jgi:hypothetical protein
MEEKTSYYALSTLSVITPVLGVILMCILKHQLSRRGTLYSIFPFVLVFCFCLIIVKVTDRNVQRME